ncbi:hypothetical protein CEXT_725331 [Caerostris extrusa]|uniref:Uncharacterized protein n=1 Tax=Caerostris extrusa TaxID=172846 RepID=A0AAV4NPM0_CAEEX|nr:hypothetical protein CEXT_725331 [Caerostris extrusa]
MQLCMFIVGGQGPPAFPSVSEMKSTLTVPTPSSCNTPEQNAESSMNVNTSPKPQEEKNDPNPPLVFDILDFQDLEAMDLGVLDRNDPTSQSSSSKLDSLQIKSRTIVLHHLDMDVEFTDWLDILTNNNSVANTNQNRINSFNGDNNDPLLPSMENGQETLDMFSLDNLDFKLPSDSNLLSWECHIKCSTCDKFLHGLLSDVVIIIIYHKSIGCQFLSCG